MSTKRHKGYLTVKLLIEAGSLADFKSIFDHIPKTTVNKDLGINYNRFSKLIDDPTGFKIEELITLSFLIGVNEQSVVDLVMKQYSATKKTGRKKA
jgi:hypothetical protein